MARRRPFDEYKVTTVEQRREERKQLRRMQKTKAFDNWLIKMITYHQKNECYYCDETITYADRESYHIEHRIPVYWGGKSEYSNLCLACPDCNRTKSTDQLIRNKAFLNNRPNRVLYL